MLNKVILQGRLTAAPEIKNTKTGNRKVTDFSVAVEENRIVDNERKVNFFRCVAWEKTAEFITKYFEKGQSILIEGELRSNSYTDKDGVKRISTTVLVSSVYFCGAKNKEKNQNDNIDDIVDNEDDLPF